MTALSSAPPASPLLWPLLALELGPSWSGSAWHRCADTRSGMRVRSRMISQRDRRAIRYFEHFMPFLFRPSSDLLSRVQQYARTHIARDVQLQEWGSDGAGWTGMWRVTEATAAEQA